VFGVMNFFTPKELPRCVVLMSLNDNKDLDTFFNSPHCGVHVLIDVDGKITTYVKPEYCIPIFMFAANFAIGYEIDMKYNFLVRIARNPLILLKHWLHDDVYMMRSWSNWYFNVVKRAVSFDGLYNCLNCVYVGFSGSDALTDLQNNALNDYLLKNKLMNLEMFDIDQLKINGARKFSITHRREKI
jgi:hypothetical protein